MRAGRRKWCLALPQHGQYVGMTELLHALQWEFWVVGFPAALSWWRHHLTCVDIPAVWQQVEMAGREGCMCPVDPMIGTVGLYDGVLEFSIIRRLGMGAQGPWVVQLGVLPLVEVHRFF